MCDGARYYPPEVRGTDSLGGKEFPDEHKIVEI